MQNRLQKLHNQKALEILIDIVDAYDYRDPKMLKRKVINAKNFLESKNGNNIKLQGEIKEDIYEN